MTPKGIGVPEKQLLMQDNVLKVLYITSTPQIPLEKLFLNFEFDLEPDLTFDPE